MRRTTSGMRKARQREEIMAGTSTDLGASAAQATSERMPDTGGSAPSPGSRGKGTAAPILPTATATCRLRPVPSGAARITGGFWAQRQRANRAAAISSSWEKLESAGNLDNLRIAAGKMAGDARGPI